MTIRSETVANVAITIMCLVVTYAVMDRFVIARFVAPPPQGGDVPSSYHAGDRLTMSGEPLKLETARVSAVVVLSTTCHFCQESADFYKRLSALETSAPKGAFQTLFLGMRGIDDAKDFAAQHHLDPNHTRPTPGDIPGKIPGTPTLLLVNAAGRVTASWVGKLTPTQETNVLETVSKAMAAN